MRPALFLFSRVWEKEKRPAGADRCKDSVDDFGLFVFQYILHDAQNAFQKGIGV